MTIESDREALEDLDVACKHIGETVLKLVEHTLWARDVQALIRKNIRVHLDGRCDCQPPTAQCYWQAYKL